MRTRSFGKASVVTTLVGAALAVGDYTELVDGIWSALGVPPGVLPLAYIVMFLCALLLIRAEYESADYDFIFDPRSEFSSEDPDGEGEYWYSETHRVGVMNYGRTPIHVSMLLRSISPEPSELKGKFGMPLLAMGLGDVAVAKVNPGTSAAFDVVHYFFDPTADEEENLTVQHAWKRISRSLPCTAQNEPYIFELILSPTEGPVKHATYELRHEGRRNGCGRAYRMTRRLPDHRWARLRQKLEIFGRRIAANDQA